MDAIMNEFSFPDLFIPHLHHMVWTVSSGHWLQVLQGLDWGLGHEEAQHLSNALLADLEGTNTKVTVIYKFFCS